MANQKTLEQHQELAPMILCPRWDRCSAPLCPLDPRMIECQAGSPPHEEPHCRLPKEQRLELGVELSWRGLWPRELAGIKQREQATPEERARMALGRDESRITPPLES